MEAHLAMFLLSLGTVLSNLRTLHHQNWDYLLMTLLFIKPSTYNHDDSITLHKDLSTIIRLCQNLANDHEF